MSFSDTLTLKNHAGTDVTFVTTERSPRSVVRIDSSAPLSTPHTLTLKTDPRGKDSMSHLAKLYKEVADSGDPTKEAGVTVNFTIIHPTHGIVTNGDVFDVVSELVKFLTGNNAYVCSEDIIEKLLRGEL
jgi:hypothetical protein